MRRISVRVRHVRHPWLPWLALAVAGWLGWSWLSAMLDVPGALAVIGAVAGVGALAVVVFDRLRDRVPVPASALWLGLASASLFVAALVLRGA